jgi:diguanylate cyclase (GGDEF)-like protein
MPLDAEDEAALAEHVRAERVRFVFIQSAIPILFSPLAASLLSAALWHAVDHARLLVWTIGLAVIAAGRVALVRGYPAQTPSVAAVRRWELTFVLSILLVDLWWGVGVLFLLPAGPAEQALAFCFLMLMAGGHSASYAAHPATVLLGVLALVVPITLGFALEGDRFHLALAVAALMFLAAMARSIKTLGYFFGRAHRLAHEVDKLARTDFLTQLNNRRAFIELGSTAVTLAGRHARPLSLVMLDVDHFKAINDTRGHGAGDAVIRAVADVIRGHHRRTDIAGRLGGEEFAVLLPETSLAAAVAAAERLRLSIDCHALAYEDAAVHFTVSVGVAELRAGEELDALIARADTALYEAKHGGRNRVAAASDAG